MVTTVSSLLRHPSLLSISFQGILHKVPATILPILPSDDPLCQTLRAWHAVT